MHYELLCCGITMRVATRDWAYRLGSATCAGVTAQGSGGTQACTAGEKGAVFMSFSSSSTCSPPRLHH